MSVHARRVLAAIDTAERIERRHPRLFHQQARAGRDCRQLSLAVERYRAQKLTVGGRQDRLDAEQPDAGWLEDRARRREERHAKRMLQAREVRRLERARLSTLELHRLVLQRATRLSTVAGSNPDPSRSHAGSALPPQQQLVEDDSRWVEHFTVIRSRLERALELVDEFEGKGTIAATGQMLGAEKDKRILGEVGLSAVAVVEKLGREIAGSPETVRRVRRAAGMSAKNGTPMDRPAPSSTVRRVVIEEG